MDAEPPIITYSNAGVFILLGFALILIGFLLLFLGFLLPVFAGGGRVGGGAVIVIGPFPIVVASSERIARGLMILAIIFAIVVFLLFFLAPYLLSKTMAQSTR